MNQAHISQLSPSLVSDPFFYWAARFVYLFFPWRYESTIDGKPLTQRQIKQIFTVLEKNKAAPSWKQGDIVIVNNRLVAHGREAFSSGDNRMIHVILANSNAAEARRLEKDFEMKDQSH